MRPARVEAPRPAPGRGLRWGAPALLYAATWLSVLWTGARLNNDWQAPTTPAELLAGWVYALPLMGILTCHELGHYVAARLHGVPTSLPYFLPLPEVSPFGTLGAVISMPERIRSRNALLDIGAAGPLAGMLVALPVLALGLALSPVEPHPNGYYVQEGQSLLYWLLEYVVKGEIPSGHDVMLHPTATAGWVGLFVTMINLLPWGQLDGGHVAFALLGPVQDRIARLVRWAVLAFFAYNLFVFVAPVLTRNSHMPLAVAIGNSLTWLVWYVLLGLLGRAMGKEHPPVEPGDLTPGRRRIAMGCLVLFLLLFMPTPLANYTPAPDPANLPARASSTASGT